MSTSKTTHEQFFKFLTKKKLNELLYRADTKTKFLENQINTELQQQQTPVKCAVTIQQNKHHECSIYIAFYPKKLPIKKENELYHISFHLYPELQLNENIGRLHVRNTRNKNRKHTIRINTLQSLNTENSIRMTLVDYPITARESTRQTVNIALSVLNTYFDPDSPNYLGNEIASLNYDKKHKYYTTIFEQFKHKKKEFRNTRKQSHSKLRNKTQLNIEDTQ
jgi:hypothetical protein